MTTLAHETLVEHQIMEHIKDALRLTLDAKAWPAAHARKLASVRFMAESFERHFLRLLELEEKNGYMAMECERAPELAAQIKSLREEHTEFRGQFAEALHALRSLADSELANCELSKHEEGRFEAVCRALQGLLQRIDAHDGKEVELLERLLLSKPAPPS